MKRLHYFLLVAFFSVAMFAGIVIGGVSASPAAATGCFSDTNGYWAEQFICWLKDNNISSGYGDGTYLPNNPITRGEMAVMLRRQAQVPPESGDIFISVGPTGWMPILESMGGNNYIFYSANSSKMRSNEVGTKQFFASADAPVANYGRYMALKGAKLCYTATTQAQLAAVTVMKVGNENNGKGTPNSFVSDIVLREDEACRTYLISDTPPMSFGEHVAIVLTINFTDVGGDFKVSSVTFIFAPTTTLVPAVVNGLASPEDAQEPIMPLSEFSDWFGLDK